MDYKILKIRALSSLFMIAIFLLFFFILSNFVWILFILIYTIILYEIIFFFKWNNYLLIIYILFSFAFCQLYLYLYLDIMELALLFIIISIFDTTSYLIGSLFGKKKIFKQISPNKTYVGLCGGSIMTLFSIILIDNFFLNIHLDNIYLFTIIMIPLSFFGDLIESFFKRKSFVKNSSNLIPGHGGFFDRFDSFILSIYGLFFFQTLI